MVPSYIVNRFYAFKASLDKEDKEGKAAEYNNDAVNFLSSDTGANLITSKVFQAWDFATKHVKSPAGVYEEVHAPVIDIDVPCTLVPSAQVGHSHLFIDVEMPWSKYLNLLLVMVEAGIVEQGYYEAALASGMTCVRAPGEVVKPGLQPTAKARIIDHAKASWKAYKYEAALREIANNNVGPLSDYTMKILTGLKRSASLPKTSVSKETNINANIVWHKVDTAIHQEISDVIVATAKKIAANIGG